MNNTAFILLVLVVLLGIVFGVAYLMDKRRRRFSNVQEIPAGPLSRTLLIVSYGVVAVTILWIVLAFVFREMIFVSLSWNFIFLYVVIGIFYRIIRPRGL